MSEVIHIPTITDFAQLTGFGKPLHPLIGMVRIEDLNESIRSSVPAEISFGFYTIGMKKNLKGFVKYGRRNYDFQDGVMAFTAPNQVLGYENLDAGQASGWYLFFHKELLASHPLLEKLKKYSFFSYLVSEALHISPKEEQQIQSIFLGLWEEYNLPIDRFSKEVMLTQLDLLLTYASRYYHRQFITRGDVDSSFLTRFERILNETISDISIKEHGLPSVSVLADQMNLSSNYLGDNLRALTGMSTQGHIHFKLIERAKELLMDESLTISEIAYKLGFDHLPYFSRLFKRKVGHTPTAFRQQMGM